MNRPVFESIHDTLDAIFADKGIAFKAVMVDGDLYFDVSDILKQFGADDQTKPLTTALKRSRLRHDLIDNGSRLFVQGHTGLMFVFLRLTPNRNHTRLYNALARELEVRGRAAAAQQGLERDFLKEYAHFSKSKGAPVALLYEALQDAVALRSPSRRAVWYKRAVVKFVLAIYFGQRAIRTIATEDFGADFLSVVQSWDLKRIYAYINACYKRFEARGSFELRFARYGQSRAPEFAVKRIGETLDGLAAFVPFQLLDYACEAYLIVPALFRALDEAKIRSLYADITAVEGLADLYQIPPLSDLLLRGVLDTSEASEIDNRPTSIDW